MTKHTRKIRNAQKIESPVTEEQLNAHSDFPGDGEAPNVGEPTSPDLQPESTTEQPAETSQDVPEQVEEVPADGGDVGEVPTSEESSEDVGDSTLNESVEEPVLTETATGRKSAIKDESLINVLMTENFQKKGSNSFGYNEKLIAEKNLTAGKAMEELGIPKHHLLYLAKEGKVEITNVVAETVAE